MLETILEFRKGVLFVRLKGSLIKSTINLMEEEVTQKIIKSGIRNVVFNVEDLLSIDLKGINFLLYNYEICNKNNGKSLLCGLKDNTVRDKIIHSRLLKYIKETDNELSAFNIMNV